MKFILYIFLLTRFLIDVAVIIDNKRFEFTSYDVQESWVELNEGRAGVVVIIESCNNAYQF